MNILILLIAAWFGAMVTLGCLTALRAQEAPKKPKPGPKFRSTAYPSQNQRMKVA